MTIIGIWKAKRELYRIIKEEKPDKQKVEPLRVLAIKLNAPIPLEGVQTALVDKISRNIHIVLQTEMMLQACIFAAASAIVSCISVMLFLFLS
ncbi:MAG: hypothetical protein NTW93_02480 [Phycisphaerae bacterium]|nr:hypothetical protein [Phycisphaerae bacterium]